MSNNLTGLIPDLFAARDIVSRELTGFIPAVTLDPSAERAAVGEAIRIPIAPAAAAQDVVPGQLPPNTGDQNIGNTPFTIQKSRMVPFQWTGEEQKGVNNGPGYANIRRNQIAQAMRTLVNEMESDLGKLALLGSRATGKAGSTPFAANLGDTAQVRKILSDNGAPLSDLQCVIDTTAGANLRTLAQLTRANEAGTTDLRAQGTLLELHGFSVRESAGVVTHTPGDGNGYLLSADLKEGVTVIPIDTGKGTINIGDVVTIGSFNYVVSDNSTSGQVTITAPGLRAPAAKGSTFTVVSAFTANFAFSRSAILLATRAPALPQEGDMADDRITITDPRTGMAFEVSMYRQYKRVHYEIAAAWGCANIKSEHTALLLG